mmetsp:Transcript_50244/g.140794  ORF Transcript_50244/g.140794 Transcript_50244/m.140794 type:complete len:294 (-) Transcript_50244:321-1202(-)
MPSPPQNRAKSMTMTGSRKSPKATKSRRTRRRTAAIPQRMTKRVSTWMTRRPSPPQSRARSLTATGSERDSKMTVSRRARRRTARVPHPTTTTVSTRMTRRRRPRTCSVTSRAIFPRAMASNRRRRMISPDTGQTRRPTPPWSRAKLPTMTISRRMSQASRGITRMMTSTQRTCGRGARRLRTTPSMIPARPSEAMASSRSRSSRSWSRATPSRAMASNSIRTMSSTRKSRRWRRLVIGHRPAAVTVTESRKTILLTTSRTSPTTITRGKSRRRLQRQSRLMTGAGRPTKKAT